MNEPLKDFEHLQNQLIVARQEINNLRKQISALSHIQQKDILNITNKLKNFKCESCNTGTTDDKSVSIENANDANEIIQGEECSTVTDEITFKTIGHITSVFTEKRGVPRQSKIGERIQSYIEINQNIFSNPEHSLDGLEEFSHLWIIYNFHKNVAHEKSKVAPPRLMGKRVGVFSTRSPHRPCPIGLSIVELDKIDGSRIYFYGTDMVDGTPVLDIKPYIPSYDIPCITTIDSDAEFIESREEPDGEESVNSAGNTNVLKPTSSSSTTSTTSNCSSPLNNDNKIKSKFKVPDWIVATSKLTVLFNERSDLQIIELSINKKSIEDILAADPRSTYLRTKHGSQIFTFQLGNVTVTCKFNDELSTVTVVQIRKTENVCDVDVHHNQ